MLGRSGAPAPQSAQVIQVPVDLVEFERRLVTIERRIDEYAARDQQLLDVIDAVRRLTEVIAPAIGVAVPVFGQERPPTAAGGPSATRESGLAAALAPQGVVPERLAHAQARLRETLFVDTETAAMKPQSGDDPEPSGGPSGVVGFSPDRRARKWLLRSLRRMVKEDPTAAGRLVTALLPAHRLAQLPPFATTPWPPAAIARLLTTGRIRRRVGWERAGLECNLSTVTGLSRLVRLRVLPAQLDAAGVRLDAPLALSLVAHSIEPRWTCGWRFAIAHREPEGAADGADGSIEDENATYLTVRGGDRPVVGTDRPPVPVAATICCGGPTLLTVLAGDEPPDVAVLGDRPALARIQRWFIDATGR